MNSLVKNSAKLLSANVVAQAIGLVVYPILTRLYTPEDFGLLNLFLSISGILSIFLTAEYHNAILLSKTDDEAIACTKLSGYILIAFTLLVGISTFFIGTTHILHVPNLSKVCWFIPIYLVLTGSWTILNYWLMRNKKFSTISQYQYTQSIVSAGSKIGFYFLSGPIGLLLGTIISPLFALLSILGFKKAEFKPLTSRTPHEKIKEVAIQYKNFPIFALPRTLLNNLGSNLPSILLAPYFGLQIIGYWGMAITLALRPIQLICGAIHQVLYAHASACYNQNESIFPPLRKWLKMSAVIGCACIIILYFVLPNLVHLLLGDGWEETGRYIRYLLPWVLLILLNTSINFIPDMFGKQKTMLYFEITYEILRLVAIGVGIISQSITYFLLLYTSVGTIILGIELVWFIHLVAQYERQLQSNTCL